MVQHGNAKENLVIFFQNFKNLIAIAKEKIFEKVFWQHFSKSISGTFVIFFNKTHKKEFFNENVLKKGIFKV